MTLVLLILGIQGTFYHPGQWNQNARLGAAVAFVEPGTPYTGTAIAMQVAGELWLGSFNADRLAYRVIP